MAANSPKSIKMRIYEVLSDLSKPDFTEFIHILRARKGEPQIRLSDVENRSQMDIADLLVKIFTENGALRVAVEILKQARFNKQAEELDAFAAAFEKSSAPPPSDPPSASSGSSGTSGKDSVDEHQLKQIGRTGTLAMGRFGRADREEDNDTWTAIKTVPQQLISRKDLGREFEVYNQANPPYGHGVGRMVDPDSILTASIGEAMSDMRGAVGAGFVINTPHLQPPSFNINAMNWDPFPMTGTSLPLPMRRANLPSDLDHSPTTTTRRVVWSFAEKDGKVEKWEQKEVVTRDGKIIKFKK